MEGVAGANSPGKKDAGRNPDVEGIHALNAGILWKRGASTSCFTSSPSFHLCFLSLSSSFMQDSCSHPLIPSHEKVVAKAIGHQIRISGRRSRSRVRAKTVCTSGTEVSSSSDSRHGEQVALACSACTSLRAIPWSLVSTITLLSATLSTVPSITFICRTGFSSFHQSWETGTDSRVAIPDSG